MNKVYQTKYGKDGNCFRAVAATVLNISIDDTPDLPCGSAFDVWYPVMNEMFEQHGYTLMPLPTTKKSGLLEYMNEWGVGNNALSIGSFHNEHSDIGHAVLMKGMDIIHNPSAKGRNEDLTWPPRRMTFIVKAGI